MADGDRLSIVTGASSGIGRATAIGLARSGANVVLVCRDEGRGNVALEEVRAAGSGSAELELCDLSDLGLETI